MRTLVRLSAWLDSANLHVLRTEVTAARMKKN